MSLVLSDARISVIGAESGIVAEIVSTVGRRDWCNLNAAAGGLLPSP